MIRFELAKQIQLVEGRRELKQTQSKSPAGKQTTAILEEKRAFPAHPSLHFHGKASQILN